MGGIIDHFENKPKQQRDDILELLARADEDDESGAFKLKLGDVANIASIGSSVVSAVHNLFGG